MPHNLLTDQLIRFETREGLKNGSLPEVYAALMADCVECFPALRAHQEPAWHMFLAQLGAIACHRAGLDAPPNDAATWQDIIGSLTRHEFPGDEPWSLIVNKWSKPAFMQPPVPEGVELKNEAIAPDALDMLITSRNHDLKQSVLITSDSDDWVFALVSLQTMEGYGGGGGRLNGIARMNKGSSSRVLMSIAPVLTRAVDVRPRPGAWLKRDVVQLLKRRHTLLNITPLTYPSNGGTALTWVAPWPEEQKMSLDQLDIWFIEVCRRVRLRRDENAVVAITGNSSSERIEAKHLNGVVGDPWAPTHRLESKALSITEKGNFHYRRIVDLAFSGDWQLPPLAELGADEPNEAANWLLVFAAIARGNTKTGGFKTRSIPLKGRIARGLGARRKELHQLATEQIREIEKIDAAMTEAIGVFGRGGIQWRDVHTDQRRNEGEKQRKRAKSYRDRLDAAADTAFFNALWDRFEAEQHSTPDAVEQARLAFLLLLLDTARDLLEEGLADIPCPSIRRPRAEARARRSFKTQLRRDTTGFPGLFTKNEPHEQELTDAA